MFSTFLQISPEYTVLIKFIVLMRNISFIRDTEGIMNILLLVWCYSIARINDVMMRETMVSTI